MATTNPVLKAAEDLKALVAGYVTDLRTRNASILSDVEEVEADRVAVAADRVATEAAAEASDADAINELSEQITADKEAVAADKVSVAANLAAVVTAKDIVTGLVPLNPRSYGAVNGQDISAAIQSCLDAAPQGARIVFDGLTDFSMSAQVSRTGCRG